MSQDPFRRVETHLEAPPGEGVAEPSGIRDLADLRAHLETALAVEQATLPPYLTALYSIRGVANAEAALVLKSIAMEEMLHMLLVANVLVALGGKPSLTRRGFVPRYPSRLPHAAKDLKLGLLPFSRKAIEMFMWVEHPEKPASKPEADRFHSLGQFYRAIERALREPGIRAEIEAHWSKHPAERTLPRQVGPDEFYGSGGRAMCVTSFASAHAALDEIMDQGEGFVHDVGRDEIGGGETPWRPAHFYRFQQLVLGRAYQRGDKPGQPTGPMISVDWSGAANMRPNPRVAEFRRVNSLAVQKMEAFNATYRAMLAGLEARFRGDASQFSRAVARMMELQGLASELMNIPSGFEDGTMAGPSFEPNAR